MRQDQFEKLQALEEKLLDTFIAEANPTDWPGHGLKLANMDQQTRGNLFWCRKTAVSVLVLANRVQHTIGLQQGRWTAPAAPSDDGKDQAERQMDDEYASAEKEAQRLMRELQRAKTPHGKA